MPIFFNSILDSAGIDPARVILVRHQDARAKKGSSPFELWRDTPKVFDDYHSHQATYNRAKFSRAKQWATFVVTPAGKTLFVGMYDTSFKGVLEKDRPRLHMDGIDRAGSCDVYRVRSDPAFADLSGRLYVGWGEGPRAWVQRADRKNKIVTELHERFKDEDFPGFLNFQSPLSKLEALPAGWTQALRSARGVYLLTCPKTREQYVGKATGADGTATLAGLFQLRPWRQHRTQIARSERLPRSHSRSSWNSGQRGGHYEDGNPLETKVEKPRDGSKSQLNGGFNLARSPPYIIPECAASHRLPNCS